MLTLLPLLLASQTPGATVVDASAVLRYTATENEPQTWFSGEGDAATLLQPRSFHDYPLARVLLGVDSEIAPGLSWRLLLDSGELRSGGSLEPPLDANLTTDGQSLARGLLTLERVKELAVQWAWEGGSIEVGRRLAVIGESLVFEDFATGAALRVDLDRLGFEDWSLAAGGLVVGYDLEALQQPNPLLHLRIAYDASWLETVGLFGAVFIENGLLQDPLFSVWSEGVLAAFGSNAQEALDAAYLAERSSHGQLAYLGLDASLLPADGWSLRGTALISFGEVSIDAPALRFELLSWAVAADASYGITPHAGVGGFLVAMSGDRPPSGVGSVDYHGFLAISPYWTWTGLFFSGGLTQGLYPGRASAAGVNGHGVIAAGARADLTHDDLWLELRLAGLWAAAPSALDSGGHAYGIEADMVVEWQPLEWLGMAVELDILVPGSFFPERDVAFRTIGQIHAHLGH
jgi:hypothetical protein